MTNESVLIHARVPVEVKRFYQSSGINISEEVRSFLISKYNIAKANGIAISPVTASVNEQQPTKVLSLKDITIQTARSLVAEHEGEYVSQGCILSEGQYIDILKKLKEIGVATTLENTKKILYGVKLL